MLRASVIGNVGRDPEQRYTQTGTMVVSFSVAVNERKRQPDGSYEDATEWIRATTFGKVAERAQRFLQKGSKVFLDGDLKLDRWTAQDGATRATLDLLVSRLEILGGFKESGEQPSQATDARPVPRDASPDLPF